MKNFYSKFTFFLLAAAIIVACDKDDDKVSPVTNEPEFPTQFSELTVEQNKAKLEDNGIELVNNLTTFKNTGGIQAVVAFGTHLADGTLPDNISGGRVNNYNAILLLKRLARFGNGELSASKTLSGMRLTTHELNSFQEFYNELTGVYTYNASTKVWNHTATGDKIVFKFPSTKTGTTNNAEFVIYGYKGATINSELGGPDYSGDYPTALKADLTVGGTKKLEYAFAATYNSVGDPATISTSITVDAFKLSFDAVNSTNEAKADYALTNGDKILLSYGVRAVGNFKSSAANDGDGAGSVITSSTAYLQIMNIKFSGEVKVKSLETALDLAETSAQRAEAWNDNSTFVVFYADSKKKIADTEFYGTTTEVTYWGCDEKYVCYEYEEGTYCYYEYDWDTCRDDYHTETRESIDIRLIFADQSKSDLENYTSVGFAELEQKFDEFIDSF